MARASFAGSGDEPCCLPAEQILPLLSQPVVLPLLLPSEYELLTQQELDVGSLCASLLTAFFGVNCRIKDKGR